MKQTILIILILSMFLIIGCNKSSPDCERKAMEIIPDSFELKQVMSARYNCDLDMFEIVNRGQLHTSSAFYYGKGNKKGENINYYYPKYTSNCGEAGWQYYSYSEPALDVSGNIIGKNYFYVKLILKHDNGNYYSVAEHDFKECRWMV